MTDHSAPQAQLYNGLPKLKVASPAMFLPRADPSTFSTSPLGLHLDCRKFCIYENSGGVYLIYADAEPFT
jgi:hypothetical protein